MTEHGENGRSWFLSLEEKRLVERLLSMGALGPGELARLLDEKRRTPATPLVRLLREGGHVSRERFAAVLARGLEESPGCVDAAALDTPPSDARGYSRRAMAYLALEEPALARADLERALELDPRDVQALSARALLHVRGEEHDLALRDLTRAIELEPRAGFFHTRGTIYHAQGELLSALLDYSRALEIDPAHGHAAYRRSTIRYAQSQYALAGRDLAVTIRDRRAPSELQRNARLVLASMLEKGLLPSEDEKLARRLLADGKPAMRRPVEVIAGRIARPRFPWRRAVLPASLAGALLALAWIAASFQGFGTPVEAPPASGPAATSLPPERAHRGSTRPSGSFPEVDYELFVSVGAMTPEEADLQARVDAALRGRTVDGPAKED